MRYLIYIFQSTLPAREATELNRFFDEVKIISIHASREGSDKSLRVMPASSGISIHASREGSDPTRKQMWILPSEFQSTLPAREAT